MPPRYPYRGVSEMVPPATFQGPCRSLRFSTDGGSSWRRVCTPWKRPAGRAAVIVTACRVEVRR